MQASSEQPRVEPAPVMREILEGLSRQVREELTLARLIDHRGESGRAREQIMAAFLRRLLPSSYAVSAGFVIDALGGKSRQMDLVVYRTDFHPVFEVGGIKHFLAEAVVAVIENKARIDSAEKLRDAVQNIVSAKGLDRMNRNSNVTPWSLQADSATPFAKSIFGAITTELSLGREFLKEQLALLLAPLDPGLRPNMYVDVGEDEKVWAYYWPDGPVSQTVDPTRSPDLGLSPPGKLPQAPLLYLAFEILNVISLAPPIQYAPRDYLAQRDFEVERWPLTPT
jgi:Domain of unknown function (DUF6602)